MQAAYQHHARLRAAEILTDVQLKAKAPRHGIMEALVRIFSCIMTLLMVGWLSSFSMAQSGSGAGDTPQYEPRLADIMSTAQLRHTKLWFAGESSNWDLAAYEIRQLKASVVEAASFYPGIPITSVTTMSDPVKAIEDAIEAKSSRKFSESFTKMTSECNACHQSVGLGFIVMRVPTLSPFSDQVFPPQGKP